MAGTSLTWILCTDLVGVSRGRAVIGYDPAEPRPTAVGWVPVNMALDAFGGLVDNPWGPIGDLRLTADPDTFVEIDPTPGESPPFRFAQSWHTDLDGSPLETCPRGILQSFDRQLRDEFELQVLAAFEHEFALVRPNAPTPFSIDAGRRAEPLLSTIVQAMTAAGLAPENILPEFGRNQIEVTHEPAIGLAAADRAVATREIVREVGRSLGEPITFSPSIGADSAGNGAHIHLSLVDLDGRPLAADSEWAGQPSPSSCPQRSTCSFVAGVLDHLPALVAMTAPSVASYLRLKPGAWSSAYNIFGEGNREAALRRAPGRPPGGRRPPLGPSIEYRPSDATANPALALAAIMAAGLDGLRRELPSPVPVNLDPASLSDEERRSQGIKRLPSSLEDGLAALDADDVVRSVLPTDLRRCWIGLKRSEIERFRSASSDEITRAYTDAY